MKLGVQSAAVGHHTTTRSNLSCLGLASSLSLKLSLHTWMFDCLSVQFPYAVHTLGEQIKAIGIDFSELLARLGRAENVRTRQEI